MLQATRATRNFELLETVRWDPEAGLGNWEWHLRRLADSACYFDFAMSRSAVCEAVEAAVAALPPICHRVRVRLARGGAVAVDHEPLLLRSGSQALRLADAPVSANDPFLYHKTTNRAVYERAAASAGPGEEVLLHNTSGFVTESTIANLAYETSDGLFTPPVTDGLLPGTLRARELANGTLRERQLPVAELGAVSKLYLLNSLRGWRDAHLVGERKQDC